MFKLGKSLNVPILNKCKRYLQSQSSRFSDVGQKAYIQGQSPEPKVREYFYYIDHEGMVI